MNPPEGQRSYSSVHKNEAAGKGHARSMLDSAQAWSAGKNEVGQWMCIDLGSTIDVQGVVTQGRVAPHDAQRVTTFTVQYSSDGSNWTDIAGTFTGGAKNAKVEAVFPTPVKARYVKIVVQTWEKHISMRAGVLLPAAPKAKPHDSLTPEKRAQLMETFSKFDTDKNGHLSVTEMQGFFKSLGSNMTDDQVKTLYSAVDVNSDGTIDFDEFVDYVFSNEPTETPEQKKLRDVPPDYQGWSKLNSIVKVGDVGLLASSFVDGLKEPLKRRQDLPDGAHFKGDLKNNKDGYNEVFLVVLSYPWLTPPHPDPNMFHLKKVQACLKVFKSCFKGKWVVLFWDWASCFQNPRSPSETFAFKKSLIDMNLWYAHSQAFVWLMSYKAPVTNLDGSAGKQYAERGWPTMEYCVSGFMKASDRLLDLSKFDEKKKYSTTWLMQVNGSLPKECNTSRPLPQKPEAFQELLKTVTFTNGSDAALVARLYNNVYTQALQTAKEIKWNNQGWSASLATQLFPVLVDCKTTIKILNLATNKLNGEIPAAIAELINLENVNLEENQLTGSIPKELATIKNLRTLFIDTNKLSGNMPVELSTLGKLKMFRFKNMCGQPCGNKFSNLGEVKAKFLESGVDAKSFDRGDLNWPKRK